MHSHGGGSAKNDAKMIVGSSNYFFCNKNFFVHTKKFWTWEIFSKFLCFYAMRGHVWPTFKSTCRCRPNLILDSLDRAESPLSEMLSVSTIASSKPEL